MATMRFEEVDRVPNWEFGFWDETIRGWHREGLRQDIHLVDFFSLERFPRGFSSGDRHVISGMVPPFEDMAVKSGSLISPRMFR